jgi:putative ABC transport system ATP-binding protein
MTAVSAEGSTSLVVSNLAKTFGSGEEAVHAVRGVTFICRAGDFVALVGPSGSGKTTLLAMIGGLLTPTAGSISVRGDNLADLSPRARAKFRRDRVGYVFQANNLLPFLTVRENLLVMDAIGARKRGPASARADQLLDELALEKRRDALASTLSGGERQRVAIGRALMNDPDLVLVDEPTASLDSERGRKVVESLIREVKDRQKTGIMVTHDLVMASMADRVLEMHDGALVSGT